VLFGQDRSHLQGSIALVFASSASFAFVETGAAFATSFHCLARKLMKLVQQVAQKMVQQIVQ
jgi:hypothetical protein